VDPTRTTQSQLSCYRHHGVIELEETLISKKVYFDWMESKGLKAFQNSK
jgi:hypothetical protein